MKKFMWIGAGILIVLAIVFTLMQNKKTIEEKNANNLVQKVFPVSVIAVRDTQITGELSLVGTVMANNDVNVTSETTGRITKCNIRVGQRVTAGSVLFEVDDELKLAQLRTAEAQFDKARKDSVRSAYMLKEKTIPQAQWDQVELQYRLAEQQFVAARRAYNDTRIKSPISGIVAARYADVGTMVNNMQSGTVVATVVDISTLKVRLQVAEKDVIHMNSGDAIRINSELFDGESVKGSITSISAKGDEAHTYAVEVTLGSHAALRPGMFARVAFAQKDNRRSIVVPRESIVGSLTNSAVYVVRNDKAELRTVVLGADMNGMVEVRSGLQAGENIIRTGLNTISNGAAVRIVE